MTIQELLERQDNIQDELEFCECASDAQRLMNEHYAIEMALCLIQDQTQFIPTI